MYCTLSYPKLVCQFSCMMNASYRSLQVIVKLSLQTVGQFWNWMNFGSHFFRVRAILI